MAIEKYIILDRDGVINVDLFDYVTNPIDFKFEQGSLEALKKLTLFGYKIIVATNQACISLGIATKKEIDDVNLHMKQKAKRAASPLSKLCISKRRKCSANRGI